MHVAKRGQNGVVCFLNLTLAPDDPPRRHQGARRNRGPGTSWSPVWEELWAERTHLWVFGLTLANEMGELFRTGCLIS